MNDFSKILPTSKISSASQAEAYTTANRLMLEAQKEPDKKLQEQIELLKAIRDHLGNKNLININMV